MSKLKMNEEIQQIFDKQIFDVQGYVLLGEEQLLEILVELWNKAIEYKKEKDIEECFEAWKDMISDTYTCDMTLFQIVEKTIRKVVKAIKYGRNP